MIGASDGPLLSGDLIENESGGLKILEPPSVSLHLFGKGFGGVIRANRL
jgi:hypothetical protein